MKEPGWITKAEAATVLGVDERTIERRARDGRIESKARPGFPTLYLATDVEILRQGTPADVRTGRVEPGTVGNGNGHSALAHQRAQPSHLDDLLAQVLQAALSHLSIAPTGPTGSTDAPTGPTLYVTVKEAAAILGLPQTDVRALIHDGDLPHRLTSRGGIRIRRKDLEAF